ncbi:hypothetical protein Mgra_00005219, partial [Meloidogyne graminicola]
KIILIKNNSLIQPVAFLNRRNFPVKFKKLLVGDLIFY